MAAGDELRPSGKWEPRGAPENEIPVGVALNAVLARTSAVAVFLTDCWVYSTGIQFVLATRFRNVGRQVAMRGLHGGVAAERVLIGVQFSDGRAGSTLHPERVAVTATADDRPQLIFASGGGGGLYRFDATLFLRPLPPPGPLTLILEAAVLDIPETHTQIPTEAILSAATGVVNLWPYESPNDEPGIAQADVTPGGWFAAHHPDTA